MRNYWSFEIPHEEDDLPMCGRCGKYIDLIKIKEHRYALPEKCSKCGWKPNEFTPHQDEGD